MDSMLERIKEMVRLLPGFMSRIIKFAVLIGLRPSEVVESVKLINDTEAFSKYYNAERQCLEHYKFPDIFLRSIKKAFLSFMPHEIISNVKINQLRDNNNKNIPTYNAIRHACLSRGLKCDMRFCRKVFASHLRLCNIQPEIVDMLQGRVSTSILTRHYLVPNNSLRDNVLDAIQKLEQQIA
jgi:intergrase/recombinase